MPHPNERIVKKEKKHLKFPIEVEWTGNTHTKINKWNHPSVARAWRDKKPTEKTPGGGLTSRDVVSSRIWEEHVCSTGHGPWGRRALQAEAVPFANAPRWVQDRSAQDTTRSYVTGRCHWGREWHGKKSQRWPEPEQAELADLIEGPGFFLGRWDAMKGFNNQQHDRILSTSYVPDIVQREEADCLGSNPGSTTCQPRDLGQVI